MITAEREIEELARAVRCPVCGRRPGLRCVFAGPRGEFQSQQFSHLGRLKLARGEL